MSQPKTNVLAVTIAIYVATFVSAIEGTIVSTALPTIVGNLHGVALMNWVFSIYLLATAMVTPIYGKLADVIGRKPVMQFGLGVFIVGSAMSGLANSMPVLIFWRAIQGIGAGALLPVSMTIIADIYSMEKRAKILGITNSAWGIAAVLAPLLGGIIIDKLSWHWIFFINVPIGLITMVLFQLYLHEPKRLRTESIDYLGSFWLMLCLLSLMLSFQVLSSQPIRWWGFVGGLVISGLSLWLFIRREQRAVDPIISLELFKNRPFIVQNAIAALINGYLMALTVYVPTWGQGIHGVSASVAGLALTPNSLLWVIGAFTTGYFLARWTPRRILYFSLSFILVAGLALALLPMEAPFGWFFVITAINGFGFGIALTATTLTSQRLVSAENVGVATSFNTLGRTIGQTLMVSIFGIILNTGMQQSLQHHPGTSMAMMNRLINPQTASGLPTRLLPALRQVLYNGLHWVYMIGFLIVILTFIINRLDHSDEILGAD
ncbi:MDR family MFS transporter [Levilactobacillus fuyuanensis]|uniref:MDR family MFS transporter n=1 Tax=Levilactobacillus fuyuanensis TaxID=2486022 RepID=A0ABW4H5A4_9LACO|nr:MDR family MFS transporter [Levilactobacillus fuyuanensis]